MACFPEAFHKDGVAVIAMLKLLLGLCIGLYAGFLLPAQAADTPAAARDRLVQDVKTWVGGQSGVSAERVEVGPLDGRLRVSPCPPGARMDFPFPSKELVRVRCDIPVWQLFIQVSVRAPKNIVVAARNLAAGTFLAEADLVVRPAEMAESEALEDRSAVVGRLLKRDLVRGRSFRPQDLDDSARVVRITAALAAGNLFKPEGYRLEVLSRSSVPAGAAPGVAPAEGSRVVRDLPAGHILLATDVSEGRLVLVARQNLSAGQQIDAGMFESRLVANRDPGQRFYTSIEGLEYSALTRNMQAGDPLRASDVRLAVLVLRGQSVLLSVGGAQGLQISVRVEALQDGRLGEQIQLKNPESGRVLGGVVTGKNTARGL